MRGGFWVEGALACLVLLFCLGSDAGFSDSYRRLQGAQSSIEMYRERVGEFPMRLSDACLHEYLIGCGSGIDGWGQDLWYRSPPDGFELFSAGPDGLAWTEDDWLPDRWWGSARLFGPGRNGGIAWTWHRSSRWMWPAGSYRFSKAESSPALGGRRCTQPRWMILGPSFWLDALGRTLCSSWILGDTGIGTNGWTWGMSCFPMGQTVCQAQPTTYCLEEPRNGAVRRASGRIS